MNGERIPDRPFCLPGCDRLDGHDGRDPGACMKDGEVLTPGPLDLVHRHPDIPVRIPLRKVIGEVAGRAAQDWGSVIAYDMGLPRWPYGEWKPMRNIFSRWHSGKICYTLPSGNSVHVKPGCRC